MLINLLFFGLIFSQLYLAVLVYNKNKKANENKLFVILTFWLLIFLISKYLENMNTLEISRALFLRIDFVAASVLGYFWLIFCYKFLEDKILSIFLNRFLYMSAIILSLLVFTDLIVHSINTAGDVIIFQEGKLYPLYAIIVIMYYFVGLALLFVKYKKFTGIKRIQTLYVLVGFFFSSVIISISNLFFQDKFSLVGMRLVDLSVVFLVLFTGLAIIKHKLFDIRKIIQRGVIYFISLSLVLSVYLVFVFSLNLVFDNRSSLSFLFSGVTTIFLGIYGVPYIEKYFQKITDKIFYKDKYNFENAVYEISEELNNEVELENLLKKLIFKIKQIVKIESIKMYLVEHGLFMDDNGKMGKVKEKLPDYLVETFSKLKNPILLKSDIDNLSKEHGTKVTQKIINYYDKYNVEACLFIVKDKKLIALLALGPKKSGDVYTDDDRTLFKTISHNIGIAIEKSILFETILNYSKNLEAKVEERTKELRESQKEQNYLILQISHSLQTPLTILKGELGLLKSKYAPSILFDRFEKPLNDLSKYIYDLLSLSRLESVHMEIKKEKINLSLLLYDLSEYFQVVAREKNIDLKNFIIPDLFVLGQPDLIETMITNFVSNAVKYIGSGKDKEIDIKLEKREDRAVIMIKDNGVGIDKNSLGRVFEKFYREKKDNKIKGTGLGMAISKRIVELHNGKIEIESKKNKGTKISIFLKTIT